MGLSGLSGLDSWFTLPWVLAALRLLWVVLLYFCESQLEKRQRPRARFSTENRNRAQANFAPYHVALAAPAEDAEERPRQRRRGDHHRRPRQVWFRLACFPRRTPHSISASSLHNHRHRPRPRHCRRRKRPCKVHKEQRRLPIKVHLPSRHELHFLHHFVSLCPCQAHPSLPEKTHPRHWRRRFCGFPPCGPPHAPRT